jgi:hypothetical protein
MPPGTSIVISSDDDGGGSDASREEDEEEDTPELEPMSHRPFIGARIDASDVDPDDTSIKGGVEIVWTIRDAVLSTPVPPVGAESRDPLRRWTALRTLIGVRPPGVARGATSWTRELDTDKVSVRLTWRDAPWLLANIIQ